MQSLDSTSLCNNILFLEHSQDEKLQPGQYPSNQSGQYPTYPNNGPYPQPPSGQYPIGVQYPPGSTAYPANSYQQAQQMTIVTQPATITTIRFTEFPTQIQCPHCHAQIVTACDYTEGTAVYLIAVVICLLG